MSQENVEIVREALEVWFGTDMQAVDAWAREHLAADFEAHPLYLAQVYKGIGAVRQLFADAGEIWDDYRLEAEDVIDLGEHVLLVGHVLGRGAPQAASRSNSRSRC